MGAALDAADSYGVGDEVATGLATVGIVEEAKELALKAGAGAKDVALRAGAGAERLATKVLEEGHETIRSGHKTIRAPAEAIGKGAEAAGEGFEAFKGLTQTQMILGGGAIVLAALLLGKAVL